MPRKRRLGAAATLALGALCTTLIGFAGAGSGGAPVTTLVSRADRGRGADANSLTPSISASGRLVAFASRARNLSPADRSADLDVFVRDLRSGSTVLVSRADGPGGAAAAGFAGDPSISADGRYVAFRSNAENISAEDTAFNDIFVRDLVAGTTVLASRANGAGGAPADAESLEPSISADGRHVAFESQANNLSNADNDEVNNIFVRNLDPQTTSFISRGSGQSGAPAGDWSFDPSISADGRNVAFTSRAALVAEDVNGEEDIYVRDRDAGTTTLVSRESGSAGEPAETEADEPAISADGRHVAFASAAKLTGQRDFGTINVFVRDLVAATTTLVSAGDEGLAGDAFRRPSISADGRYVAWQTRANEISQVDANGKIDVFVRDLRRGLTVVASRASGAGGLPGDGPSANASISADGRFVAFDSRATNFSGVDEDEFADVFRRRPLYAPETPLPECKGRVATKLGTPRDDVIAGTNRKDVILAFRGDDVIRGFDGGDTICAGVGRDRVLAGKSGNGGGFDLVLGGLGADRITLGPELGRAHGEGGNDVLIGSDEGGDGLHGGPGADLLRGRGNPPFNSDFLFGGPGPDRLFGGAGPDHIRGGPGRDIIDGGAGSNDVRQ